MPVIEMRVSDWINIPDNPRQRNTVKRATYAVRNHLSKPCDIHRYVYGASKNGTIICKLDGHTRAYLWNEGMLDPPSDGKVEVLLVEVSSLADAKDVYDQLDSVPALKKPSDVIFGATRENRFKLTSPLLKGCSFATQLKIADSGKNFRGDIYKLVRKWKEPLTQLDNLNLTNNYTILISLMLIAVKRDGIDTAGQFFKSLDDNTGTKDSRGADGVEALRSHMEVRRAEGTTSGYENLYDILCRGWYAYECWKDGKRIKKGLKCADLSELFSKPKKEEVCQ